MTDHPTDQDPPEEKIIIDEDWKSQVEAEKEDIRQKQEAEEKGEPTAQAGPTGPLPPPSLEVLASSLGMQAMMAMGLIPNPATDKAETRLDEAKHLVDTVAMLEEKTEGNRTPEESRALGNLLHELRMAFVAVQRREPGN
jgi:hypothetical protein